MLRNIFSAAVTVATRGSVRNVTPVTSSLRTARQEGLVESSLSLRHIHALAQVLGLTTSELLAQTDAQLIDEPTATASEDAATLIPLLVRVPRLVAIGHLGRTLEWDRSRLTAALDANPAALRDTGLRLHTNHEMVKILRVAQPDKGMQRAFGRIRTDGRDLNQTEAAVLTRVINGENVLDRMPSNPTRVAIGSLKNMGCTALADNAVFTVTDELRLALPDI